MISFVIIDSFARKLEILLGMQCNRIHLIVRFGGHIVPLLCFGCEMRFLCIYYGTKCHTVYSIYS